jgi:predicted glycosyltransferase involved in capsule biosynthesis
MKQVSIVVTVLDSHAAVRRQLLHFNQILSPGCELILIDDGSVLPLRDTCSTVLTSFDFVLHATNDRRAWTQPRARNIGASLARAPKLLFFDIDHILTSDIIATCLCFTGDKLHWVRRPGILDEHGFVVTDPCILADYGMTDDSPSIHGNSFLIRRELFERLGGYDERFCGRYGGDDVDFNVRYEALVQQGLARPAEVAGEGYVFPDPAKDVKKLFHSLPRAP